MNESKKGDTVLINGWREKWQHRLNRQMFNLAQMDRFTESKIIQSNNISNNSKRKKIYIYIF